MCLLKPCYVDDCGELNEQARCPAHRPPQTKSRTARGYPWWWQKLSRQAIALQPFCSTCQTPGEPGNPLTLDHTPQAWNLVDAGKRLTIKDVASGLLSVQCLRCNIRLGKARGHNVTRTNSPTVP